MNVGSWSLHGLQAWSPCVEWVTAMSRHNPSHGRACLKKGPFFLSFKQSLCSDCYVFTNGWHSRAERANPALCSCFFYCGYCTSTWRDFLKNPVERGLDFHKAADLVKAGVSQIKFQTPSATPTHLPSFIYPSWWLWHLIQVPVGVTKKANQLFLSPFLMLLWFSVWLCVLWMLELKSHLKHHSYSRRSEWLFLFFSISVRNIMAEELSGYGRHFWYFYPKLCKGNIWYFPVTGSQLRESPCDVFYKACARLFLRLKDIEWLEKYVNVLHF